LTDDPEAKLNYLKMAVDIYKGAYLPELEDTWVIPERDTSARFTRMPPCSWLRSTCSKRNTNKHWMYACVY